MWSHSEVRDMLGRLDPIDCLLRLVVEFIVFENCAEILRVVLQLVRLVDQSGNLVFSLSAHSSYASRTILTDL